MFLITFALTSALFIALERLIPARPQAFWRRGMVADLLYIPINLFVGPEMHLWHHARDPRTSQVNFGDNLSIFDWMLGTARVPATLPTEYGPLDES